MAVTNTQSTEAASGRQLPIDTGGKLRLRWFTCTQGAAAGDAESTFELGKLGPGRFRVLPGESKLWVSAYGASRVMSLGHGAYVDEAGDDVAADYDAFGGSIDVATAINNTVVSATIKKFDIFSPVGAVTLYAQVTGGTIPAAATLAGFIAYVAD